MAKLSINFFCAQKNTISNGNVLITDAAITRFQVVPTSLLNRESASVEVYFSLLFR